MIPPAAATTTTPARPATTARREIPRRAGLGWRGGGTGLCIGVDRVCWPGPGREGVGGWETGLTTSLGAFGGAACDGTEAPLCGGSPISGNAAGVFITVGYAGDSNGSAGVFIDGAGSAGCAISASANVLFDPLSGCIGITVAASMVAP